MKVTSTLLSVKSFIVRVHACVLIIALLAPLTIPLAAKESKRTFASPATIAGNLAAPEPMSFSGIAENADNDGALASLAEQMSSARSILPTLSLAFFGSSNSSASKIDSSDKETSSPSKNSNSVTTTVADADPALAADPSTAESASVASAAKSAPDASAITKNAPAASSSSSALLLPARKTAFDFDGDGKADVAVWRPTDGTWWVFQSSTQDIALQQWGAAGDRIVPADYDNDGKTDHAVYTPSTGNWSILQSSNGQATVTQWGAPTDVPVPGDFDGDGKADIAVWRPSTGYWYVVKSSDSSWYAVQFGSEQSGDVPVVGDYDGDRKADVAVWRASTGNWYAQRSSDGVIVGPQWGAPSDIPVPADYDGDEKTDYAVWRPSTNRPSPNGAAGEWFILNSSTGAMSYSIFGESAPQDVMAPADYDGDLKADIAVWRPSNGTSYIWQSSNSAIWQPQLGVAGDLPVPSAFIKQPSANPAPAPTPPQPTVARAALGRARLSPKNATGGTNLYSRNFSWGTGLVNLPGRAGMDAGLALSYNSLVWTKVGNTMAFDADKGNVAPGFRFGFPVIEPVYTDEQTNKPTFLMVAPSGSRTDLRQTDISTNLYESVDSSYLQLERIVGGTQEQQQFILRGTDGTQLKYVWKAGAYRCAEVKDSNGNIITVNHDGAGLLRTVKDTLGRIITVSYDNTLNPTSITQAWAGGVTHTWVSFSYTTAPINYNFGGLAVSGPANGTGLKVLDRVTFADNSTVRFEYNSYGQVRQVNNYAADNHKLNHVAVNVPNDAVTAQTDCPRFSETRSYAENFNNNQEVVVTNTIAENQTLQGVNEPVTLVTVTSPDGVVERSYSLGRTDWLEGLPFYSETCTSAACAGSDKKRWVSTSWTQDNSNLIYLQNPRVVETKVSDASSTKRTTVEYLMQPGSTTVSRYGLVRQATVYDTNQTTVLKTATTDYNLSHSYLDRRIIGLPSEQKLYDKYGAVMSRVTYVYDTDNFTGAEQNISPVQHDNTSYGAGFTVGRGNLSSMTRHDVTGATSAVTSSMRYNTAGAVVSQTDPLNRSVSISYADVFSDIQGTNTFAYPTKITDPAGYFSQVKYRYDIGVNVWARSPAPQGHTTGKETTRTFDSVGRLQKQAIWKNNLEYAYTRYVYPDTGVQSQVFTTVNDGMGEAQTETLFDGAGRVRKTSAVLPGSSGGWSGTRVEYDIMGRVKRSSVPTEINSSWNPAGDDYRGVDPSTNEPLWLWTSQEYDWKGRVTKEINTDGTFKTISYQGCGCAGGQVTTVQGEEIIEKDWQGNNTVSLGKRTQRVYDDILGRTWKTEVLNWNGTVYSTVVNTLNGRDQVTNVTQTEASTSASQVTALTYDGHGRLETQRRPEQTAATTYSYNSDDSIKSVVDARGASTNYAYNDARGLLTNITYGSPNPTQIPDAAPVTFGYDNAGNRISMQDGLGTVSYVYNQLSQMTSETRAFSDNLPNSPQANNSFKLEYDYTLSGQLKFYKDPYGQKINYAYDNVGRLSSVVGETSFAGITIYASNPQYRAWGGLKGLSYGNNTYMSMTFNNRLQADHYEFNKSGQPQPVMSKNYEYYPDQSLRKLDDALDDRFDRLNTYDHLGRPKTGKSGAEARGGTVAPADMETQLPYRQSYQFNAFNNMTERLNLHWGVENWYNQRNNLSYTYQNNRITNAGWTYDADGRVLTSSAPDDYIESTYDAKGQLTRMFTASELDIYRYYEGGGREAKRKKLTYVENQSGSGSWAEELKYYIRSSVLGGEVVSEVNNTGKKLKTFVRAAGTVLAWQMTNGYDNNEYVTFEQSDASGMSQRTTMIDGSPIYGEGADGAPAELDPLGGNVGLSTPYYTINAEPPPEPQIPTLYPMDDASPTYVNGQRVTATLDGMSISYGQAMSMLQNGSAIPAALAGFQGQTGFRFENSGSGIFRAFIPGSNSAPPANAPNDGGAYGTLDRWITFFAPIPWSPGMSQQGNQTLTTDATISRNITPRTLSEGDCNFLLNHLFGNLGSVVASAHEPKELLKSTGMRNSLAGADRSNTEFASNIHLYGDVYGTRTGAPLYVPVDHQGSAPKYLTSYTGQSDYAYKQVTFYSGSYGEKHNTTSSNRFIFQYNNGLTVLFAHVGGNVTTDFLRKGRLVGPTNLAGSYQLGFIGGPGGINKGGFYVHSHLAFWRNSKKINPRIEFCGGGSKF